MLAESCAGHPDRRWKSVVTTFETVFKQVLVLVG